MITRVLVSTLAVLLLSGKALAQFGPPRETPRSAAEIYADRAVDTAASFLQGSSADVLTDDDKTDPDRAQFWFDEARTSYDALCNDRSSPKDEWARNCHKLANLHLRGQGTPQDYDLAAELFLAACRDGGHTDACLQQAYTDHIGNAGEKNWPRARDLYDRACSQGAPAGCAGLGNMLYRAQGGLPDRVRATRLLQDACNDEYDWACDRLDGFGLPRRKVR